MNFRLSETLKKDKTQRMWIIILFLIIPVSLLMLFSYYPALKLLQLSITDWNGIRPTFNYIGFENYIDILKDESVIRAFKNNMAYIVASLVQVTLALYLAIILDRHIRAKNFFRLTIFLPYILNGVAVAFMFNYLFDFTNGPLNVLLGIIGIDPVQWLPSSYLINFSLASIGIWRFTGFSMIIFLGALQSIDKSLYEAAAIEGAGFSQIVRYITFPGIKRVIELNLFLSINGALKAYFEPFVITKGGPFGMSETFVTKTLKVAFDYQNYGKAAAMGMILIIFTLLIVAIQRKVLNKVG